MYYLLFQVPVYQFNCSPVEDLGYDNLPQAIQNNEPIFGPKDFNPSWGTTLVGQWIDGSVKLYKLNSVV